LRETESGLGCCLSALVVSIEKFLLHLLSTVTVLTVLFNGGVVVVVDVFLLLCGVSS